MTRSNAKLLYVFAAVGVACLPLGFVGSPPRREQPIPKPRPRVETVPIDVMRKSSTDRPDPSPVTRRNSPDGGIFVPDTPVNGERLGAVLNIPAELNQQDRVLLERFAGDLRRSDVIPPLRKDHFSWWVQKGVKITGWSASILEVTKAGDDWMIKIYVTPNLAFEARPDGSIMYGSTDDHVVEIYLYSGSGLRYLSGTAPDAPMRGVMTF